MFTSTIPTQQIDDMSNAAMGGASNFSIDHVPLCSVAGKAAFSHWQVIGGSGTGGILVRQGQDWSTFCCEESDASPIF